MACDERASLPLSIVLQWKRSSPFSCLQIVILYAYFFLILFYRTMQMSLTPPLPSSHLHSIPFHTLSPFLAPHSRPCRASSRSIFCFYRTNRNLRLSTYLKHTYKHTRSHTHTHIHTYIHTHAHTHTLTHTHIHTHIHSHAHTYTHIHKIDTVSAVCVESESLQSQSVSQSVSQSAS